MKYKHLDHNICENVVCPNCQSHDWDLYDSFPDGTGYPDYCFIKCNECDATLEQDSVIYLENA